MTHGATKPYSRDGTEAPCGGVGINAHPALCPLVLPPPEVAYLDSLADPVTRIKLRYAQWPTVAEWFVPREDKGNRRGRAEIRGGYGASQAPRCPRHRGHGLGQIPAHCWWRPQSPERPRGVPPQVRRRVSSGSGMGAPDTPRSRNRYTWDMPPPIAHEVSYMGRITSVRRAVKLFLMPGRRPSQICAGLSQFRWKFASRLCCRGHVFYLCSYS